METSRLSEIFRLLSNERRLKIILLCKTPHTVTQISKKLKIPLTRTSEYLTQLKRYNLISKKRNSDNSVTITSLIEVNDKGEVNLKGK